MQKKMLSKRLIAAVIALFIIISTVTFVAVDSSKTMTISKSSVPKPFEEKTTQEISNMTGVPTIEINHLRTEGKSWNEIMELLKNKKAKDSQQQIEERSTALAQEGLTDGDIAGLKREGFSNEEVTQAKMLAERVLFQLKEILQSEKGATPFAPQLDTNIPNIKGFQNEESKEDLESYKKLLDKIQLKTAVTLTLQLKNDFGSYERVLDEYLYSKQAEIDLNLYLEDKDSYRKSREENSIKIDLSKVITIEKIEAKMLEKLNKESTEKKDSQANKTGKIIDPTNNVKDQHSGDPLPEVPIPKVEDIRPKDPAQEIMKEIEDINQRSLGQ